MVLWALSKYVVLLDYNAFNVYCCELAPGTVSLTGDRAQGDDSKHWAYSSGLFIFMTLPPGTKSYDI